MNVANVVQWLKSRDVLDPDSTIRYPGKIRRIFTGQYCDIFYQKQQSVC